MIAIQAQEKFCITLKQLRQQEKSTRTHTKMLSLRCKKTQNKIEMHQTQ